MTRTGDFTQAFNSALIHELQNTPIYRVRNGKPLAAKTSNYLNGFRPRTQFFKCGSRIAHASHSDYLDLPAGSAVNVRDN